MLKKDKDGWITSLKIHKEHKPRIEKSPIGIVAACSGTLILVA